jgi:Mg2+-importing ATPase
VTISLSTGARRLARRQVVVKRLVSIEDLGNIQVLFTDKTGTLTEGSIQFAASLDVEGRESPQVFNLGLLCNQAVVERGTAVGGNPLDRALWTAAGTRDVNLSGYRRIAEAPFDFDRRLMSVLVETPDGRRLQVTKGAPESVVERCADVPPSARGLLDRQFAAGSRVVAVAIGEGGDAIVEEGLALAGFLTFIDPPKADATNALARLAALGITVKIITGDNEQVAQKVLQDVGLTPGAALTGADLDTMDDAQLAAALAGTSLFARVNPEQKSRVIRVQRSLDVDVGFLGDGVNDAVALHEADVGISVESATDVAKDAADIVLVTKDLAILADGVVEGRRIFANTIKYVLMGTSSNFGNMFSAAGASLFLDFLPMLPTQILLNNLLYDISEMTIPTDNVDSELLERPARWDTKFIRRFMMVFGPISSAYDFLTFGVLLLVFHASAKEFHTAWFVESLSTQTLVIFVIRTRRIPFFKSRPSTPLLLSTLACATTGIVLPYTGVARVLGFTPLPWTFMAVLAGMIVTYLALVQVGVARFFRPIEGGPPLARRFDRLDRIRGRATRWTRHRLPSRRPAPAAAE